MSYLNVGEKVIVNRESPISGAAPTYRNSNGDRYVVHGAKGIIKVVDTGTNGLFYRVALRGLHNSAHEKGWFSFKDAQLRIYKGEPLNTMEQAMIAESIGSTCVKTVQFNKKKRVTVVVWKDNSVTKVICQKGDKWNEETGLLMCFAKKLFGGKSHFNDVLETCLEKAIRIKKGK